MRCILLYPCLLVTTAAHITLAQVDRAFDGQLDILGGPTFKYACACCHRVWPDNVRYAVNNVGSNVRKPTVEYSTEDYRHVMSTNLDSTYRLCQVRTAQPRRQH